MKQITLSNLILIFSLLSYSFISAQTLNESSGTGSLVNITSGDYNTAFGDSTGSRVDSGSFNTLIGFAAAGFFGHDPSFSEVTAIGYRAGYLNRSGTDNVFIGFEAGYSNNGTDNTFIGAESGENNTSGVDNTFIGEESGFSNTTGDDNTYLGQDAGANISTGSDNTFVGSNSGGYAYGSVNNGTGYRNTGLGNNTLSDLEVGHHNTGLGDSAGTDVNAGIYNTFVGAASGVATEHADYNTFIGAQAGWDNNRTNSTTNANHNTYLGYSAGFSNREGQFNVGMGSRADFNSTNRSNAIFIGYDITASNNNVMGFGNRALIYGEYSISLGHDHDVRGRNSVMLGYLGNMQDLADYSVGIGDRIDIEENDVVGIGRSVDVDNQQAVAIGSTTIAQNDGAIVIGYTASSTDPNSIDPTNNIAIGYAANVQGTNAIAIGNAATATNDNTMILGGVTNPLSVGIGTDAPDALASLDLGDTNKGILFNRLTDAQITTLETSLTTAHKGLALYDSTNDKFQVWDGTAWQSAANTDNQELALNGSNLGITNSMNTVDLSPLTADLETRVAALENATGSASSGDMTPLLFNYQSVIRDTDGNPIKNDAVDVRIAVREDGVTGTIVYNEEHSLTSSEYGVLSLQVGGGTLISGDMANITWGEHEYYLEVSLDTVQTGTFTTLSTTQLLSVPYALHARSADFITGSSAATGSRAAKSSQITEIQELKNQVKQLQAQMQLLIDKKK